MEFSAEQKAAEQLCKLVYGAQWDDYSPDYCVEEINRVVAGRGIQIAAARVVPIQMQLNVAVELLRQAKRALEVAGYSPSSITDFLSAFPCVPEPVSPEGADVVRCGECLDVIAQYGTAWLNKYGMAHHYCGGEINKWQPHFPARPSTPEAEDVIELGFCADYPDVPHRKVICSDPGTWKPMPAEFAEAMRKKVVAGGFENHLRPLRSPAEGDGWIAVETAAKIVCQMCRDGAPLERTGGGIFHNPPKPVVRGSWPYRCHAEAIRLAAQGDPHGT